MAAIEEAAQDVRHAFRLIRKNPLLSAATIATLALGIGLDTGVFTLVEGMLFRPRTAFDPASFVELRLEAAGTAPERISPSVSLEELEEYRASAALRDLAGWTPAHASVTTMDGAATTDVVALLVTCTFFSVADPEPPLLGRTLAAADCDRRVRQPAIVIGEAFWRSHLAADPNAIGRTIAVNRTPFTIVGVMRSEYSGQLRGPIWAPYTTAHAFFDGRDLAGERTTPWLLGVVGRLAPGVSRPAAAAALSVIARQRDAAVPGRRTVVRLTNGSMIELREVAREAVWIVPLTMGALSVVLLIACGNVAMLVLSRAVARRHEIAVRLTLGAARRRLLRMLLAETVVVAAMGMPLSASIAYAVPIVFRRITPTLPYYPFQFDGRVFAYLAGATLVAGLIAGLAPAIESLKRAVLPALREQELGVAGARSSSTRTVLIALEVAMSLVFVLGAALFVAAERRLLTRNPGYDAARVLIAAPRITSPPDTPASAAAAFQRLVERIAALQGVASVAVSTGGADSESGGSPDSVIAMEHGDRTVTSASIVDVSSSYFATLGIPVRRGIPFRDGDSASRPQPVIVSESLARALAHQGDPLGALVRVGSDGAAVARIVAIVGDVESTAIGAAEQTLYRPLDAGAMAARRALLIRFAGDERRASTAIRDASAGVDPRLALEPRTLAAVRAEMAERFMRLVEIVTGLAGVALALAVVGIYGVVAFATGRRAKEVGIRIALGATTTNIVSLLVVSEIQPVAIGAAIGIGAAAIAARGLARVFERTPVRLDPSDPAPYVVVVALLITTAVLAMLGPAYRAASSDPVHALRQD